MTPAEYGRGFGPDIDSDDPPTRAPTDEQQIAKIMATTGIDRAGAEQAMIEGHRLAAELIEAADADDEPAPRKKRRKGTSPTARTLAECRRRGWIAGVVERHIPFPKPQGTTIDLFGVIDLVAIAPILPGQPATWRKVIVGIQVTASAAHHAHRRDKILAEPRMLDWLATDARLELWSWSKRGAAGKAKRWAVRIERFEVRDGKLVGIEDGT